MTKRKQVASEPSPPAGLEAVYLAHRSALLRFLRARGAGSRAEDLVQELWLRIILAPGGPVDDPLSYLYAAANNLMHNSWRAAARRSARDGQWGEAYLGGEQSAAEVGLVAREEIERARERLAACSVRVQEIYLLFRIEGLSQRDIACRLGLSLSTVEKDVRRAYAAIAALRDEDHG